MLTMILYALGAAIIFALSNAFSYGRGHDAGFTNGYNHCVDSAIEQVKELDKEKGNGHGDKSTHD